MTMRDLRTRREEEGRGWNSRGASLFCGGGWRGLGAGWS